MKPRRQLRRKKNNPEIVAGRITIFLGKELKQETIRLAKERGNSVSGLVRVLLKKWIKAGRI